MKNDNTTNNYQIDIVTNTCNKYFNEEYQTMSYEFFHYEFLQITEETFQTILQIFEMSNETKFIHVIKNNEIVETLYEIKQVKQISKKSLMFMIDDCLN